MRGMSFENQSKNRLATKWGGLSGATVNNWCVGHCRCGAIKTRGPSATSLTWESVSINEHILANLWLFHYVDQERKKILSPFENWMVLIWLKLNSLHPRMGLCQVWLNGWNYPLVLVKKILKYGRYIFAISLLSFLGNACDLSLALDPRMLCAKFGWN